MKAKKIRTDEERCLLMICKAKKKDKQGDKREICRMSSSSDHSSLPQVEVGSFFDDGGHFTTRMRIGNKMLCVVCKKSIVILCHLHNIHID